MRLERVEKGSSIKKIVLSLSLIAVLSLIVFIFYFKGYTPLDIKHLFTGKVSSNYKVISTIKTDVNKKANYMTFEDKILEVSKEGVRALSIGNKEEWQIKLSLSNPLVTLKGKYIFIADEGSKTIALYQGQKKVWNKTVEGNILNTKVNSSGYSLIISQLQSGREILVYSPTGSLILKKDYINQGYLMNADISENKKIVTLSVFTEKSRVGSKIDYFDLKSTLDVNSTPICGVVKEDVLAVDIKIFSNGNIVLVGDNSVFALDANGAIKWVKDFNNIKVYKANISSGKYVVLETNGMSKGSFITNKGRQVDVINQDGVLEGQAVKITSLVDIDTFDDYFVISDGIKLYSISKGKLVFSCPLERDIKYIKGFFGKSQILLVGKDYIEVIEVI